VIVHIALESRKADIPIGHFWGGNWVRGLHLAEKPCCSLDGSMSRGYMPYTYGRNHTVED
jgi:hypothetical protein